MRRQDRWMAYEDRKLREYWLKGFLDEEIAFYLGRSVVAIKSRRHRLRLVKTYLPRMAPTQNTQNTHNSPLGTSKET